MLGLTDIPDWVTCESMGVYDYDFKTVGNPELYDRLYKMSPISHIDKVRMSLLEFGQICLSFNKSKKQVKTPTLFMIGSVDLRVPPSQGKQYHNGLLSRGVPSK